MQDIDLQQLRATISAALSSANKSARAVSLDAGMGPDTLGKFLNGHTQSLRADNLARVLRALVFLRTPLDA